MNHLQKAINVAFFNVLQTKRIFCLTFHNFTISGTQTETYIQLAIPYLPMWLAAICLVMNVLIPGTGKPKILLNYFLWVYSQITLQIPQTIGN